MLNLHIKNCIVTGNKCQISLNHRQVNKIEKHLDIGSFRTCPRGGHDSHFPAKAAIKSVFYIKVVYDYSRQPFATFHVCAEPLSPSGYIAATKNVSS